MPILILLQVLHNGQLIIIFLHSFLYSGDPFMVAILKHLHLSIQIMESKVVASCHPFCIIQILEGCSFALNAGKLHGC